MADKIMIARNQRLKAQEEAEKRKRHEEYLKSQPKILISQEMKDTYNKVTNETSDIIQYVREKRLRNRLRLADVANRIPVSNNIKVTENDILRIECGHFALGSPSFISYVWAATYKPKHGFRPIPLDIPVI